MSAADSTHGDRVLPLPALPPSQVGTSTASHRNYRASVSNAAGYLCHIHLECDFDVRPQVLFDIFSHPDNAGAFRDIKQVGYRKVKLDEPGFKIVEVEQCGELRVMWITRTFRTYLDVTEDSRDPDCLKTDFTLLRSDILSRFHGSWELRPKRDAAGEVVGCHAQLEQDVLPKGVPSFFAHLPVLGGMLRRVSLHTIQRLVEDILVIVSKYKAAKGSKTLDDVMAEIALERGHTTLKEQNREASRGSNNADSHVASFAIDSLSESEESVVGEDNFHMTDQLEARQGARVVDAGAAAVPDASPHRCDQGLDNGFVAGCRSGAADGEVTAALKPPAAGPAVGNGTGTKDDAAAVAVPGDLQHLHGKLSHH